MVEQIGRGTLGQQTQEIAEQEQVKRPTRTERVAQQQEIRRFELARKEAQKLKDEEFVDKTYEEAYTHVYYIPTKYIDTRTGLPTRQWRQMSQTSRDAIMRQWQRRTRSMDYYVKVGYLKRFEEERKREVHVPFTFDTYKKAYQELSPEVRQFFSSPQEITAEREKQKEVDLGVATGNIEDWQLRIKKEEEGKKSHEQWWREFSRSVRFQRLSSEEQAKRRAEYKRRMREYDNTIGEYRNRIRYLQHQWSKIGEGYNIQNILIYAIDKAYYDYQRWEGRTQDRYRFEISLAKQDKDLMKSIETLGLDKSKVTFQQYQTSVQDFNKQVARIQSLQQWGSQVTFEKLPEYAQAELRSAYALPEGEVLKFDTGGRITGVRSEIFQGVFTPQEYETKVIDYQKKIEDTGGWDAFVQKQQEAQYQRIIFDEEEEARREKGIVNLSGFEFIDDPFRQVGTISDSYTGQVLVKTKDIESVSPVEKGVLAGIGWGFGKVRKGFKWVDDRVHFTGEFRTDLSKGKLPIFQFGKLDAPTGAELSADILSKKIEDRQLDRGRYWVDYLRGEGTLDTFQTDLQTRHTETYDREFWKSDIGRELFLGEHETEEDYEKAFVKAQTKFAETETGIRLQKEYVKEFGVGMKELQTLRGTGWRGTKTFFVGGAEMLGYNLAQLGLSLGRTPTRVGTGALAVKTGVGLIKGLPTIAKTGLSVGLTTWGTTRALDPTRAFDDRFVGFVTAGIGAVSLSKATMHYLKAPTTKTVMIATKPTLKASHTIGKDFKILKHGELVTNKVLYPTQKLSQIGQIGRRTIVSQKWRDWGNLLLRKTEISTRIDPVYRGVPTWQPVQYGKVTGLRGTTIIKTAPSGYEKAFKLLRKYAPKTVSDSEIKGGLRYHAPKVYEGWLKKGVLDVKDKTARGLFVYELRQPQLDLGAGIKTRAGRTVQDMFKVQRALIEKDKLRYVLELKDQKTFILGKRGARINVKGLGQARAVQLVSVSDARKGWELLTDPYKIKTKMFQEGIFRELTSVSKDKIGIYAHPIKAEGLRIKVLPTDKGRVTRTILWDRTVDLKPVKITKIAGIKRTPLARTFREEKPVIDRIIKRMNKPTPQLKKESAKAIVGLQTRLKGTLDVQFAPQKTQFKDLTQIHDVSAVGLTPALMLQLGINTRQVTPQRTGLELKPQLKEKLQLKQPQLLEQSLRQETAPRTPTTQTPIIKPPIIKDLIIKTTPYKLVKFFPPPRIKRAEILRKRLKAMKLREKDIFGALPDFTARALGIKPKKVKGTEDARRELKRLQTGLGIRKGVRMGQGISDGDILKGVIA